MKDLIEVKVLTVLFDRANQSPILLLKEKEGGRILPIWIGFFEAQSILLALKGIILHRPLTHDLCLDIINSFGGKVDKVNINKLEQGTFYAQIILKSRENKIIIDARPSDSIAIAIRQSIPIYVSKEVLDVAAIPDESHFSEKEWDNILESIPDEAFGKYNM